MSRVAGDSVALSEPYNYCCNHFIFMKKSYFKTKKGLDLHLKGEASRETVQAAPSEVYTIVPDDFHGIVPRPVVKEGDAVEAGVPLFVDKATERVRVVSPVSGVVKAVRRGERRKILGIDIAADGKATAKVFPVDGLLEADADVVRNALQEAGLFAFVRQRPYDVVADPASSPKGIFVSAFSKMPLAADVSYVLQGREADFRRGITLLSRIAPVFLGIMPEQTDAPFVPEKDATVSVFDGPNPSGNVGVQINHVSPINKGEVVWCVDPGVVCMMGDFAKSGRVTLSRRIAVAGSGVDTPRYVEALVGAALADVLRGQTDGLKPHTRLINGNPLVGRKTGADGHLAAFATEVCAIPEGDDVNEVFGWMAPRLNDFSVSHSYFSWLFSRHRRYDLDCRIKGGQRHMIMSGEYDRVFPMDIFAGYLVKAIIAGDIDKQEALGIYEVAPEDFAVAEFVDSSKLELQRIVREGLDILRKENA